MGACEGACLKDEDNHTDGGLSLKRSLGGPRAAYRGNASTGLEIKKPFLPASFSPWRPNP